jgi:UDP-GlcNAc:undecaprenyl-phosphate/decaprenyl-phosphate GlcNAc-1-phosphate transferase
MRAYVLIIAVTAITCLVLTPLIRRVALAGRAYSPHRTRDMHVRPVPKLGGVAMVMAVLVGMTLAGTVPFLDGIFTDSAPVRGLLAALGIITVLGIVDDLWDLRWWGKMAGQIAAALAVALGGIRVEAMPFGWIPVGNEPVQILLTVFVIVLTMNAINFVDGLDGLAAGVALIGGSAFFMYSYLLTRTINEFDYSNLATLLMALLVGAAAGFLPYNVSPAKIFMGEVGALVIGLLLATAAVAVTADLGALEGFRFRNVPAYMPILLPLAVLALPLLDLTTAVIRRTARGSSPFSADRGHLHHKLVDGGYTQPQAVALLWLWSFLVSWGAVSLNFFDHLVVLPVMAVLLLAAGYLTLHPMVRRRRHAGETTPDRVNPEEIR